MRKKKHKCTCTDPGHCVLGNEGHRVCGIDGMVDYFNVKITDKKVICISCEKIIYETKTLTKD